ncbi:hypothetical protein THAOC_06677 [Thalassiosira oceanica]|uniref:Fibronectin type-III domain-containing protein n=1 Tax=Thalassiosira oceanica TaxID=159749 RepID=K0TLG5_THAOC|nr:hypothetical protein THAOC_06677 [Thalassiosira oceanica]|eukprot:EJK71842.1 hypothetical protein THAOC_06677 [Thalassiosira oceanica]
MMVGGLDSGRAYHLLRASSDNSSAVGTGKAIATEPSLPSFLVPVGFPSPPSSASVAVVDSHTLNLSWSEDTRTNNASITDTFVTGRNAAVHTFPVLDVKSYSSKNDSTGGFHIVLDGKSTAPIQHGATDAEIKAELEMLESVGKAETLECCQSQGVCYSIVIKSGRVDTLDTVNVVPESDWRGTGAVLVAESGRAQEPMTFKLINLDKHETYRVRVSAMNQQGYSVPSVLTPASVGVLGDNGVHPARPSALYTPTGPLGRSVASVDLKQPSMHRRSSVCRHEQFFLSHVSLLQAADVAGNRLSRNRAQTPPRERDRLGGVSARFAIMSSLLRRRRRGLTTRSVGRSVGRSLY